MNNTSCIIDLNQLRGKNMDKKEFNDFDSNEILEEENYLDETQVEYERKYEERPLKEKTKRLDESRSNSPIWNKLGKYYVDPHQDVSLEVKNELVKIIQTANDENVIHDFLKMNPFILTRGIHPAHHAQVCISKPKLGSQLEPDFLIAGIDSGGFNWYGVELESPKLEMFTKHGEETKELKHAIRQIEDWRSWLSKNVAYARDELGLMHIDSDLPCFIFIGRRKNEVLDDDELMNRRRAVTKRDKHGLYLHHYEWLIDVPPTLVKYK